MREQCNCPTHSLDYMREHREDQHTPSDIPEYRFNRIGGMPNLDEYDERGGRKVRYIAMLVHGKIR